MCDLNAHERDTILKHIKELEDVLASIQTSAHSIEDRAWMDHGELSRLLARLCDTADQAQTWVQHKVHAGHG
jgi:hypothetical protein